MAGIRVEGNSSGNVAEVNALGQLKVAPETDAVTNAAGVGAIKSFSENDPGTLTGTPYLKSPETSSDFRLRTGTDSVLLYDSFNYSAQNTSLWSYTFATLTCTQPGAGTLNFGTVQGTTNAHGAFVRSFRQFPLISTSAVYVDFVAGQFNTALVTNEVFLFGFGLPSAAVTIPTDGAWFSLTTAGLIGVLAFSGVSTQTGVLMSLANLTVGELRKFTISVSLRWVEFWHNDVLLGRIAVPVGNSAAYQTGTLPVFMQKYNTGNVSSTNTMRVASVCVSLADFGMKDWGHQLAGSGQMAYQGQSGGTIGSTQAIGTITTGSSAIPTSAAGSNTAANAVGLGGTGAINAAATAATDFIATSFQVPAGTINISAKTLYITGVKISTMNTGAAVATTPTTLQWAIGFGHTAVSMQTAETGTFVTATTKTPRRVLLGFQSAPIATAIGGLYAPDISMDFSAAPIVVNPGEFINTFVKQIVGTATASQTITYIVTFTGYFE